MSRQMYSNERQIQILISLLKAHGIQNVIASPGVMNFSLLCSMMYDGDFKMYSSVDERSAAYIACGMAEQTGEPVVITCTGATASRNYMPGLTEAYYKKLPVIAVTCAHGAQNNGQLIPQHVDRTTSIPSDIAKISVDIRPVRSNADAYIAEIQINRALLEAKRHGGGPVHINLNISDQRSFDTAALPKVRVIRRHFSGETMPALPCGRIAVFCGHGRMTSQDHAAIDNFCRSAGAVVFCEQGSNYYGHNRFLGALAGSNLYGISTDDSELAPDLLIHIGETYASYVIPKLWLRTKQIWRVSEDGELRDTFKKLTDIFEMRLSAFFDHYSAVETNGSGYYEKLIAFDVMLRAKIPELPFSAAWIAQQTAPKLPSDSKLSLAVLNAHRVFNYFPVETEKISMNSGGFGIDGAMSAALGSSLAAPSLLHFTVIGDLAFFYDMNCLGNRHVNAKFRILLINNNCGAEFHLKSNPAALGSSEDNNRFTAAGGHYANHFAGPACSSAKAWVESLGYTYMSARDKEEFLANVDDYVFGSFDRPVLFECFTEAASDANAIEILETLNGKISSGFARRAYYKFLPANARKIVRKLVKWNQGDILD